MPLSSNTSESRVLNLNVFSSTQAVAYARCAQSGSLSAWWVCDASCDPKQQARFLVAGCQDVPGFEAVAKGEAVDVPRVLPHVVELVQAEIAKQPKIRAVLLECTELPPYADAIRAATHLPVLDAITLVDFFHAAVSENPYFGIDWDKLASTPAFR